MCTRAIKTTLLLFTLIVLGVDSVVQAAPLLPNDIEGKIATGSTDSRSKIQAWQIRKNQPKPETANSKDWQTPLGSIWKLFVYSYLKDQNIQAPDYVCTGAASLKSEELYCCDKGEKINQTQALVQSCGLFFQPTRLNITNTKWQNYWKKKNAPLWLQNLKTATSEHTEVKVPELLQALNTIPTTVKNDASQTLLLNFTSGRLQAALPIAGTGLRIKTFTMPDPQNKGTRIGGGTGWLADGTPIWLVSSGGSPQAINKLAPKIQTIIQSHPPKSNECVNVSFFANYPIIKVETLQGKPAPYGLLQGQFRVLFQKGTSIIIESNNDINHYRNKQKQILLIGKMGLNQYVARVLDREAATQPKAAAWALSIAIRSYLLQEAQERSGACVQIDDSTKKQRVSPRPATASALRIAEATDQLVLSGAPIFYHLDKKQPQSLSWQQAVIDANKGQSFIQILATAYPKSSLTVQGQDANSSCKALPNIQKWLEHAKPKWHQQLRKEAGFEPPRVTPTVCLLEKGKPYSDQKLGRIYIRQSYTEQTAITLAHEYLHFVFPHHPNGQNETYIENMARRLTMGPVNW